jgi:succinate dehydrogenase / fumarate reductase cytochrome b subunit
VTLNSLVLTLTETLRYRGDIGQWSWVLHRLSGLGVVLFLTLHVIDTSWAVFYPALYEEAIASYQSPLFTLGEFGLIAAVVYHAYNGIRIVVFDYNPRWWKHQKQAAYGVLALTALTLVPVFALMVADVLDHYGNDPYVLSFDRVILSQLPFAVGIAAAVVGAVILSGIVGLVAGNDTERGRAPGSRLERFWWSYMRVSGVLILPLVFGHLAMMHVLQGVFALTEADATIIGTRGLVNVSGTATEFILSRWNTSLAGPGAGVAIWKLYDLGLLFLVVIHGFNGLRYVLTDYTSGSPFLRRASAYLCVIAAVILLVVGASALFASVETTTLEMACHAQEELGKPLSAFCQNLISG